MKARTKGKGPSPKGVATIYVVIGTDAGGREGIAALEAAGGGMMPMLFTSFTDLAAAKARCREIVRDHGATLSIIAFERGRTVAEFKP
jgi:hypothetical protein